MKRALYILMSCIIMFMLPLSTNVHVSAVNTSVDYNVYNATNGKFIKRYTLSSLGVINNSPKKVKRSLPSLEDNRVIDWTKHGVAKIITNDGEKTHRGTGFVVDEHTIATAAHVLYNSKVKKIMIFNGNSNDKVDLTAVEYHMPYRYFYYHTIYENMNYSADRLKQAEIEERCYDYALITVKEDLTDYMCFNLAIPTDRAMKNNLAITCTGFPAQMSYQTVNNEYINNMYSGTGRLLDMDQYINQFIEERFKDRSNVLMCYDAYISGGNSGGPIYYTESYNGKIYYSVIGICIAGGGSECNMAIRNTVNTQHFFFDKNNKNWT